MKIRNLNKSAFSLIELSIVILIIGILVAGVTQGSRLIKAFKLSNARTLTQSSPVHSIKGLSFWLDAASETTILNRDGSTDIDDEDFISSWDNSSLLDTGSTACIQATQANQPQYISDAINGMPAIQLNSDSTNAGLACNLSTLPDASHTIFIVLKFISSSSDILSYFFQIKSNSPENIIELGFFTNTTATAVFSLHTASGSSADPMGEVLEERNNAAIITKYNKVDPAGLRANDGLAEFKINGAFGVSGTSDSSILDSLINPELIIGAESGETNYFTMNIGEIIIFDRALKVQEREDIEKYLSQKWAIKLD
jgi:prepilin-type N-terminal cleavage/methylation domain-containing protein